MEIFSRVPDKMILDVADQLYTNYRLYFILDMLEIMDNKEYALKVKKRLKKSNMKIIEIPEEKLTKIAEKIGIYGLLADQLWKSNIYEARLLALKIADLKIVPTEVFEEWVKTAD